MYYCRVSSLTLLKNALFLSYSNKEGLDLVKEAIERAGYTGKVKIGMDVAASEFLTGEASVDFRLLTS